MRGFEVCRVHGALGAKFGATAWRTITDAERNTRKVLAKKPIGWHKQKADRQVEERRAKKAAALDRRWQSDRMNRSETPLEDQFREKPGPHLRPLYGAID
jgi:hypothetical protein